MNITNIFDRQSRNRYLNKNRKKILKIFRSEIHSTPCFVMGKQRSGTNMLLYAFHRHKDIEVFDEAEESCVFSNYLLKDDETVKKYICKSKFPAVVFKPLADSHNIDHYLNNIKGLKIIWIIRDYRDVANSSLVKFPSANQAIRKVFEGKTGGGWFQEGLSDDTLKILLTLDYQALNDFDLACLVWWARNRIYLESSLMKNEQCMLLEYEKIVENQERVLAEVCDFINVDYDHGMKKFIHSNSVRKNTCPTLHESVEELCDHLMKKITAY